MPILRWTVALLLLGTAWTMLGLPAGGMLMGARSAPADASRPAIAVEQRGERLVAGKSYREPVGDLIHLHLEGPAGTFGYAQGLLVGDRVARIERDMMGVFVERVPSFWARHLVLGGVNWYNRRLHEFFASDELAEIEAITAGHAAAHDPFLRVSPSFARGLQYHALHDISQYLIDNPLVQPPQVGCTAVAVGGARSADGHLLVGRLFDFEGGACFDLDKVVYTMAPEGGHRFVHVAWGGMAGAVTGLNDAGLWVSLNAAATDVPPIGAFRTFALGEPFVGRPIVMVVREILERCATIDEALAVIRAAPVFVSNGILLASGREGRAVVAERGPRGMDVRAMADDRLVLTNHFLGDAWKADRANAGRMRDGTTTIRSRRAEELLLARGKHDPASVLALCRDHRGLGGADVGFGNRSTINAWIGAHLVVADVTAGVIWVCEPRHGLGRALAFDVDGPRPDLAPLPADPELEVVMDHLDAYRSLVRICRGLVEDGERAQALPIAERLMDLDPNSFEAHALLAQCVDDPARRRQLLERALALQPAYGSDRRQIERALAEAR